MRLIIIAVLTTAWLTGCASAPTQGPIAPAADRRDGNSWSTAIVLDAQGDRAGTAAEFQWIADRFPGSTVKTRSLVYDSKNLRIYESFEFVKASGKYGRIFFDVTKYADKK